MNTGTATHCMIYVTTGSRDEAVKIGRTLVEEKLAACANILGDAVSIYRWQGKVTEEKEVVLIAKTRSDLADKAMARVKALHSYDVPCVVSYGMTGGLAAYLNWIDEETV